MDASGFTGDLRNLLFRAITGRGGDVSGRADGDVTGMLAAAYGPGQRGRPVDTRAAAADLGVSQRTVQRWIAGADRQRNAPSQTHLRGITRRARQTATTKAGRRRALTGARRSRATRYGTKLRISGHQGPYDPKYRRDRAITLQLDPDAVNELLDAYESGGDRGVVGFIEGYTSAKYYEEWQVDSFRDLRLGDQP